MYMFSFISRFETVFLKGISNSPIFPIVAYIFKDFWAENYLMVPE